MLNKSGESGLILEESIQYFIIKYSLAVGFFVGAPYQVEELHRYSYLSELFGFLFVLLLWMMGFEFCQILFASVGRIMCFFFSSLLMW